MTSDPYVIAVTQRKGGDGKTTIATHVAAGLALTGGRSLIPVLDGLEATDPYLSGTDKDGPR